MIQIDDIHIEEFRGIRDLRLSFGSQSFVISGPNGTGKSGVVDALDFVLTGDVSRLKGRGSGGLTLARHAPHVHRRDDPAAAVVTVTVRDPATDETAKLSRSVKTPSTYSLVPDQPAIRALVDQVTQHPEVTLSRREIIKFIIAESGKRSEEVQALLKLERLGRIRSALRSAKTTATSAVKSARSTTDAAAESMKRHLDVPELLEEGTLKAVNARRVTLGLAPLPSLEADDLTAGMTSREESTPVSKATAGRDLDALVALAEQPTEVNEAVTALGEALGPALSNPSLIREFESRSLVEAGLALVVDETCPLCDHGWPDPESLRAHLDEKLARSKQAADCKAKIDQTSRSLTDAISRVAEVGKTVRRAAVDLDVTDAGDTIEAWLATLDELGAELQTVDGALLIRERLDDEPLQIPEELLDALANVRAAVDALPDTADAAAATRFLAVAQERFAALRNARTSLANAQKAGDATDAAYEAYCAAQDEQLGRLYESVESNFGAYYRQVNTDEAGFKAALESAAGKLDLTVDFYAQGMFPPAAYHSEGHQDGMGVCLYLTLMKELLGDDFRLAILDDVVMSVDAGHRRQFCDLLRAEFPDVQFIITTHDEIWARQMQKSKLVSRTGQARFMQWDVDHGPWVAAGSDFWDEVEQALQANDIPEAAWRLRRNLERVLSDLADEYRCAIPYSASGSYELGEFLSGVKRQYGKLLRRAADAANSWGDDDAAERVAEAKSAWQVVSLSQDAEQWTLNPAVHFNEWATFSKADFQPVVAAWKEFLAAFDCSECDSGLYISQHEGTDDALRCDGGHVNLNLRKKK